MVAGYGRSRPHLQSHHEAGATAGSCFLTRIGSSVRKDSLTPLPLPRGQMWKPPDQFPGICQVPQIPGTGPSESLDRRPDVRRGSSSPNQPHGSLRCKLHRLKSRPFHPSHRHGSGPDRSEVAGPCPHDGHQDTGSSLSKVQRESHRLPCVLRKLCAWNVQADGPSAREFLGHAAMLDAQGALSMPNPL